MLLHYNLPISVIFVLDQLSCKIVIRIVILVTVKLFLWSAVSV